VADSVTLIIGAKAGAGVPLKLVTPDGVTTEGSLDLTQYSGHWSLDEIHKRLNDKNDRLQAESIGKGLFERLIPPGTALRTKWDEVTAAHPELPLELEINEPSLRGYPWEFVWDTSDHRQARVGGMVRRAPVPPKPAPATANWPFRLLVIVGVDDEKAAEADRIGARREVDLLRRSLVDYGRSVDIYELDRPSQNMLQGVLKDYQPHAVHFIGHGTIDLATKRNCVVIENPQNGWNWDTVNIGEDFKNAGCVPLFVFLNCCRSANAHAVNLSLQQTFTERVGAGAVVAMQADVRGDQAGTFSKAFYSHALAAPGSPDLTSVVEALRKGRLALGSDAEIDWALPALTFCRDVPIDVKLLTRPKWPTEGPFQVCREFDEARVYADEAEARRKMIQWLYPIGRAPQPNILIVRGPARSGKSRLLTWCLESWVPTGHRIRHIAVDRPRGNCAQWLVRLRAGDLSPTTSDPDRFLRTGLDLAPFLPFYDAVAGALNMLTGPAAVPDRAARVNLIDTFRAEVTDSVSIEPLCARFLEGLKQLGGPVLIVIDQVSIGTIRPELFTPFRDSFLAPLSKDASSSIRVALSVESDNTDPFGLDGLGADAARIVKLRTDYKPEQLEQLAVEALRYREEATLRQIAQGVLRFSDNTTLGQLDFCQPLLKKAPFRDLERMR